MVFRRALLPLALCLFVSAPVFALTRSWTGTVSANWSDSGNWSPSGIPSASDSLTFPSGASHLTMINDLPVGTSVGAMTIFDVYSIQGNALTLTGDLSFGPGNSSESLTFAADVKMGAPLQITAPSSNPNPTIRFSGAFDVNGQTLTLGDYAATHITGSLSGTGSIVGTSTGDGPLEIAGGGSFSGS